MAAPHLPTDVTEAERAARELDEVPAGPYHVRLAAMATERGIIFCGE
jgi:hypothetical protein